MNMTLFSRAEPFIGDLPYRLRTIAETWLDEWRSLLSVPSDASHPAADTEPYLELRQEQIVLVEPGLRDIPLAHTHKWTRDGIRETELRVPVDQCLILSLTLPSGLRKHLPKIIPQEIEQRTPFKSDETVFDYVLARSDNGGSLNVEVYVLLKRIFSPLIDQCAESNWRVTRLGVSAGRGVVVADLDLLNPGRDRERIAVGYKAGAIAFLVALCAFWLSLVIETSKLEERQLALQSEAATMKAEALQASEFHQELESLRARAADLQKAADYQPVSSLLDQVAQKLPDDTWVRDIRITDETVTLVGVSGNAGNAAELLSQAESIEAVSFLTAIEANPDGTETFSMRADRAGH